MSLLRCLIEHFVAPPGGSRPAAHEDVVPADEGPGGACTAPAPRTPPGVALLCAATGVQPFAAALGLALARRGRAPIALICVWTAGLQAGGARGRVPASPAARRLATALRLRGLSVRATGRLVAVALPAEPLQAVEQARRAMAASGGAPTVLALGGPRNSVLDELLFEQDLVVVVAAPGGDPAIARLAALDVEDGRGRVCVCEVALTPAARTLAAAGLGVPASARRALAAPVDAST